MSVNFLPHPCPAESCGWGMVCLRSTPFIGVVVSEVQRCRNVPVENEIISMKMIRSITNLQYSKCERLGALITLILGIALLVLGLASAGMVAATTFGAVSLALGTVILIYACQKANKDALSVHTLPTN